MSSSLPPGLPSPSRAAGAGPVAAPGSTAASSSTASPSPNPLKAPVAGVPPSQPSQASPRS